MSTYPAAIPLVPWRNQHLSTKTFSALQAARDAALVNTDAAISAHHDKVTTRLEWHPPVTPYIQQFKLLLDAPRLDGYLPMSNRHVRRAASAAFIDAVLSHYVATRTVPGLRHFLFTAVTDAGYANEHQPTFAPPGARKRINDALRAHGLHGVCATELDVLSKRIPGETGRRFLQHDHGIVWTTDPDFRPRAAAAAIMELRGFSNSLGIPAVTFMSRAESATRLTGYVLERPDEDQTEASMAHLSYYLLKALACAKNRVPRLDKPGTYRLLQTSDGLTQTLALRAAEFWSHVSAFEAVYGVGDGKYVRAAYARTLREWERSNRFRANYLDPGFDRDRLWRRYWWRRGPSDYEPWHSRI